MRRARRLAWEPDSVPGVHHASQPSSTLEGQVLHHLVQEEHLGPTVAELEDPRHRQLAPETKGRLASWLQRVQELFQTPVQELRPVSPASAPAELEDIQAEASAPRQGPKLEPQEHSGLGRRATAIMVPGLTEPEPCPDPMSPWDIPGVVTAPVPGPELEPHEPLGPGPGGTCRNGTGPVRARGGPGAHQHLCRDHPGRVEEGGVDHSGISP
nr:uncharacterized protein LOC108398198 [Manis javanica]